MQSLETKSGLVHDGGHVGASVCGDHWKRREHIGCRQAVKP